MTNDLPAEVASRLLESARLSSHAGDALFDKALDLDYWARLNPALGVGGACDHDLSDAHSFDSVDLATLGEKFAIEGYFQIDSLLPTTLIDKMRACVELVRTDHWPPVFTFIYDEFWTSVRTAFVDRLLCALLGSGYRHNSAIWTYYVIPRKESAGWPPHNDGNGNQRLTIWIPLTDATLDNGCIFVIPRNLVPGSLPPDFQKWESVSQTELRRLLQCSRALPAKAGAILGWDHNLIHWGSMCHGSPAPRISIAMEFLGVRAVPTDWERPLLDGASLPTFTQRLHMIGKSIVAYKRFEPLMIRYAEFADRLMARCQP